MSDSPVVVIKGLSRIHVRDEGGAGDGAIALPQLIPVRAVVGREEQRPIDARQVAGVQSGKPQWSLSAVALPQTGAGGEEPRPVPISQLSRVRPAAAGVEVVHKARA